MKLSVAVKWLFAVVVVGLVIGYGGLLLLYRANEAAALYQPRKGLGEPPAGLALTYDRVTLTTSDGVDLVAVAAMARDQPAPWLLYLHGSGHNVMGPPNARRIALFQSAGLNVLAVDYRGFGDSAGEPSEAGLYLDAEAAYRHLTGERGVSAADIVLYGWSLGAGVAVELSRTTPVAGLVLEGAFESAPSLVQDRYPWLLADLVSAERFASVEKVAELTMPMLFVHAVDDEGIPIEHGRALYDLATASKTFLEISGGHEWAPLEDSGVFRAGLAAFLAEVLTD